MIGRAILIAVFSIALTIGAMLLIMRERWEGASWSRARAFLWGAAGVLSVALVIVLALQVWFLWNRAQDGENAWICLHAPQAGCGVVTPAKVPPAGSP